MHGGEGRGLRVIDKRHEEDGLAATMLRNLNQIREVVESRLLRNFVRELISGNHFDRRNFNFPWRQSVSTTDLHVRPLPDSNARRYLATLYSRAEAFRELHCGASV